MKPKLSVRERAEAKQARIAASKPDRAAYIKTLIDKFKACWIGAGEALQELYDKEYWKDTHTSWIAFCKDNFGISKTKLWNVLEYTKVVAGLSVENQPKITNIAQALALSSMPEKDRNSAIEKAEKNGGITAENLKFHAAKPVSKKRSRRNVTDEVTSVPNSEPSSSESAESKTGSKFKPPFSKKDKKVVYDEIGIPIPNDAIPFWERRQEVQDVLTQISKLKSVVVGGREKEDHQWLKVTNNIADTFDSLRSLISEAKPYAVCTTCQGSYSLQPEGCNFCRSTGLISKWQWDTQSRQEIKDIILRRAADLKKERETK